MRLAKILTPILLTCLFFAPLATGAAYAASGAAGEPPAVAAMMEHQIACEDGVCSLRLDLGDTAPKWLPATGFAVSVLENNLHILPDGAGFSVTDGVSLQLPVGNLQLDDARLNLTMTEDGSVESFYGTAKLPMPSLGLFSGASTKAPVATTIGFDTPDALPEIGAVLDPARKYLFFDLAAGTELEAPLGEGADGTLWLSIPQGQRATIVLDPQERYAYVDGNVTLRYSGNAAFLAALLDPTQTVDLFSGELPLRHEATVHVSGVVADGLAQSRLELAGRYGVDGGKAAEWLKLEGQPLALEGSLVIGADGILGTGVVRSALAPANVWDGAVQAQVFVPFSKNLREAYVALNTRLDVPFADISADGYARVDGALDLVAQGGVDGPWRDRILDGVASVEPGTSEETATVGAATDRPSRWLKAWSATADGAQKGLEIAGRPAGAAAEWMKNATDAGVDTASGGISWTVDLASHTWCSTTGLCRDLVGAEADAAATAMR